MRVRDAGAWFEGFINAAGEILLADDVLFNLVDTWICGQKDADFIELLPLLRRAYAGFDATSGRRLLERVQRGQASSDAMLVDDPRAAAAFAAAVPLLKTLLDIRTNG